MKSLYRRTLAFCLIAILSGSAAKAQNLDPLDYRRTLFAPAGQRMLILEAPLGMCFNDETKFHERKIINTVNDMVKRTGGGQTVGVFAPCMDIAGYIAGGGPNEGRMPIIGIVTWLNPSVGDTTPLARADYLDMQETQFANTLASQFSSDTLAYDPESFGSRILMLPNTKTLAVTEDTRRTADGVTVTFEGSDMRESVKWKTTGIAATTVIKRVPLAVTLMSTTQDEPDPAWLEALMDKFLLQQIALNEG
ncbi:MAG: hypothetical protein OXT65_07320 [Alphaproteobacteria bacterium]|nr:hypothetical protein [Alphaproteobacteria bacterium]